MTKRYRLAGLTVLELVIIIAILVLLALIITPRVISRVSQPGTAQRITRVAGPDSILQSSTLSSVAVRVEDAKANAVPNVPVEFSVEMDGDGVMPATAQTDSSGIASTVWTIGSAQGTHVLRARVSGRPAIGTAISATIRTTP